MSRATTALALAPTPPKKTRGPDRKATKRRTDKGPGRPRGSKNVLPLGAVQLIKSLKRCPPEGAPEEDFRDKDDAYNVLRLVMLGQVPTGQMLGRMKAASIILDEVCGTLVRKFEVADPYDIVARLQAGRERAAATARREEEERERGR